MDDILLIQRAVRGDEDAFRSLIERHRDAVYRIAYKITLHEQDALDVCQCVYWKLADRLGQYRPTGSFRAWLSTMTTRTAIDFLRRNNRKECSVEPETLEAFAGEPSPSFGEALDDRVRLKQIHDAMRRLSPQQRAIFALRFEEDLKPKEIAERLDTPAKQVRVQLCRAMKTMREALEGVLE